MENKLSLLIHGPVGEEWIERIARNIGEYKGKFEKIVLVSYVADTNMYLNIVNRLGVQDIFEIVECLDVFNPGFFNINRQIKTVRRGLEYIEEGSLVIKLRNDQVVNFNKLSIYLNDVPENTILTTNCFTRRDRLYHPSDMLLCGRKKDLERYYSCPYMNKSHLMHIMEARIDQEDSGNTLRCLKISPESYLFRGYLAELGWELKETQNDSFEALRKFVKLVDSWDVDFRWKKKRTPFLPVNSLILPYYFTKRPFEGGPLEKCRCINSFELNYTRPTIKAVCYILLSRTVFYLGNCRGNVGRNAMYRARVLIYGVAALFFELMPHFVSKKISPLLRAKLERYLRKLR